MWCLIFGVILIIKTMIFLRFRVLADISVLFILSIIKICKFSYKPLLGLFLNICSMHIGLNEFARYFFSAFLSFFQDGHQNPMSLSRA